MGLFDFFNLGKLIEAGKDIADEFHLSEEEKMQYMIEKEKLKLKEEELDIKEQELYLKDTQNARNTRAKIATSEYAPFFSKIFPDILALFIITATFWLFYEILQGRFEGQSKDVAMYILGILSAVAVKIAHYYYGSSAGSKQKTEILKKTLER